MSGAEAASAPAPADVVVHAAKLQQLVADILAAEGLPKPDAETVAASLVEANLRGVDSHGVSRVPIYVERLRKGLVDPDPAVTVVTDSGGALLLDGGNGMGQVVLHRAMQLGLERLPGQGSVSIALRNSNHYGSGAFFAKAATAAGAALFLYGNAPATMSAWGGREPFLGTNPYTFAVPAGSLEPIILDMATSVVARGKIILASQLGQSIPEGWAVDRKGMPTTDADEALEGSVLPFGGPKGYGIALMVEIMAAMFSGANSGPGVGDLYEDLTKPQGVGAFFTLVDIAAFQPRSHFDARMTNLVAALKASGAAGTEVLVPGEIEARVAKQRLQDGICIPHSVAAALEELSDDRVDDHRGSSPASGKVDTQ